MKEYPYRAATASRQLRDLAHGEIAEVSHGDHLALGRRKLRDGAPQHVASLFED
jgi:hypothetical protein